MSSILVKRVGLRHGDAVELIAELDRELTETYPEEGATHFRLDVAEVAEGRGAFLVAYDGRDLALGCGAVRLIGEGCAEIKRMYTRPASRGRGVATRLLAALEQAARDLGASEVVLETGERQDDAIALYQRHGYRTIAPFGEYVDSPLSVCFGKRVV